MTPSAVGLVLVEGHEADGEIVDQDAFDVPTRRGVAAISTSAYVAGALSRARAIADRRRPHAIGVTWSDDFELEASQFLKSLSDAGYDNIVAVRSPEAGEALARGIARAVGYHQTAVCLLEPGTVVVSVVDTVNGAVETVRNYDIGNELIRWLTDIFDSNGWHPEAMIVVGPDGGIGPLVTRLEHALGMPVFAPPEAELALARGAALASAQPPENATARHSWPRPYTAAVAMLAVGVVTFVVSVSLLAGLKLAAHTTSTAHQPAAPPPAPPAVAQAVPIPAAPPPTHVEVPPPPQAPAVPAEPPATVPVIDAQISPPEVSVPAPPPESAPPPPEVLPPPPTEAPPPASPDSGSKPPLLTRILEHVPGLHSDPPPP